MRGKPAVLAAWRGFFDAFADYRNAFERMEVAGEIVCMAGRSHCADARLDGPALWRAVVRGARLCEWRVYEDTEANRRTLGLD